MPSVCAQFCGCENASKSPCCVCVCVHAIRVRRFECISCPKARARLPHTRASLSRAMIFKFIIIFMCIPMGWNHRAGPGCVRSCKSVCVSVCVWCVWLCVATRTEPAKHACKTHAHTLCAFAIIISALCSSSQLKRHTAHTLSHTVKRSRRPFDQLLERRARTSQLLCGGYVNWRAFI